MILLWFIKMSRTISENTIIYVNETRTYVADHNALEVIHLHLCFSKPIRSPRIWMMFLQGKVQIFSLRTRILKFLDLFFFQKNPQTNKNHSKLRESWYAMHLGGFWEIFFLNLIPIFHNNITFASKLAWLLRLSLLTTFHNLFTWMILARSVTFSWPWRLWLLI